MKRALPFILALGLSFGLASRSSRATDFTDENPQLKKFLYAEQDSRILFGFGVSPLGVIKNKAGFALSIFQVHWMRENFDFELLDVSFGITAADRPETNVKTYTFRMAPKYRLMSYLSLGPLVGLEFINFPDVKARIGNGEFFTDPPDSFSNRGLIYGLAVSENFKLGEKYVLKANQVAYRQTYSTHDSSSPGWTYSFSDTNLNRDSSAIAAGTVFLLEFSFLY